MPKVAILGGGIGALAAAWKLSEDAANHITIYQRDWLLGGKGASTHDVAPPHRVYEHGIHLLFGFYDNMLTMLRDCYAELAGNGIGDHLLWNDALIPWDDVGFAEEQGGAWDFWHLPFPTNTQPLGGDGSEPSVPALVENAFGWFIKFLHMLAPSIGPLPFVAKLQTIVGGTLKVALFLVELGVPAGWLLTPVRGWLERTLQRVWTLVAPLAGIDWRVRKLWIALWFTGTNLRGLIADGLLTPPHDFGSIDGSDYRAWLQAHNPVSGLPPKLSWSSPPVRGLYDLGFAWNHLLGAGTVLYNALRIGLDYKGHVAYKMASGMGDVVFAPLYNALRARQVEFRFFHEVTKLHCSTVGGQKVIHQIDLATPYGDTSAYSPLSKSRVSLPGRQPKDIDTWPSTPTVPPVNGPTNRSILKGSDFDVVVLGISVAALPALCGDLMATDSNFNQMVLSLGAPTNALDTQSIQLWVDTASNPLDAGGTGAVMSFARPFNSWLDMTHILACEEWPAGSAPQALGYFSDELPPTGAVPPAVKVAANLVNFVNNDLPDLWSGFTPGDLHGGTPAQYPRANTDPSDRYVIFAPGTVHTRLAAGGTAFVNLALAGDWVRTTLNSGCIEAATLAGFAAAAAIGDGTVHG
jgi:uncharacterized protein with NAD-binding domain and iron-sulfur cluster